MNLSRWLALMNRLGLDPSEETCRALIEAHSGPSRHYHNVEHVTNCLDLVDQYRSQIPNADLVELAFWFHDAVYDAQSKTNELDSANWATQFLEAQGATENTRQLVYELIMATQHTASDLSTDAQWMVDIDLSILGAEPTAFDQYEKNIRLEYAWVPDELFHQRRADLLEGFLARPRLFNTAALQEQFEAKARENLQRSIVPKRDVSASFLRST